MRSRAPLAARKRGNSVSSGSSSPLHIRTPPFSARAPSGHLPPRVMVAGKSAVRAFPFGGAPPVISRIRRCASAITCSRRCSSARRSMFEYSSMVRPPARDLAAGDRVHGSDDLGVVGRRSAPARIPCPAQIEHDERVDVLAQQMAGEACYCLIAPAFGDALGDQLPPCLGHCRECPMTLGRLEHGRQPERKLGKLNVIGMMVDINGVMAARYMPRAGPHDVAAIAADIDAIADLARAVLHPVSGMLEQDVLATPAGQKPPSL